MENKSSPNGALLKKADDLLAWVNTPVDAAQVFDPVIEVKLSPEDLAKPFEGPTAVHVISMHAKLDLRISAAVYSITEQTEAEAAIPPKPVPPDGYWFEVFLPVGEGRDFLANLDDELFPDWVEIYGEARAKSMYRKQCRKRVFAHWLDYALAVVAKAKVLL